jgi:hypothetical protein
MFILLPACVLAIGCLSDPVMLDAPPAAPRATPCATRDPKSRISRSPDGHVDVFVSTDASRKDATGAGDSAHQDLCVIRDGGKATLLLAGRGAPGATPVEQALADFDSFVWSPDGARLYFTSSAWAVSTAAHVVEIATGHERFLTDGAILSVLASGPYKGKLLASHFRLDADHPIGSPDYQGRVPSWDVLDTDGHRLVKLPDDEKAQKKVLDGR